MYQSHYGLKAKPFQISVDPKFLWLGEKHKEALATLKYAVLDNKGFLLMTGDVGTGKTTLINTLVNGLGPSFIVATVLDPGLDALDFFNFIASAFGIQQTFDSKGAFLVAFRRFLERAAADDRQVLLIIDESQRLNPVMLEEIRLLSNIESQARKLINIFFVGQSEFNEMLWRPENRALRQRVTINYKIQPLDEGETRLYIAHRIRVAGGKHSVFDAGAMREVFIFSGGYPRLINILCDHALLTGYVRGVARIDAEIIEECAGELRIPEQGIVAPTAEKPPDKPPEPRVSRVSGVAAPAPAASRSRFSKTLLVMAVLLVALVLVWVYGPPQENVRAFWSHISQVVDQAVPVHAPGVRKSKNQKLPGAIFPIVAPDQKLPVEDMRHPLPASRQTPGAAPVLKAPVNASEPAVMAPEVKAGKTVSASPVVQASKPAEAPAAVESPKPQLPSKNLMIYFGYNSNSLSKESIKMINTYVPAMIQTPGIEILVKGFADRSGNASYNMKLSEFRADIVQTYLLGRGVPASRIKAIGMGVAGGDQAGGNEKNDRRVEIQIVKK